MIIQKSLVEELAKEAMVDHLKAVDQKKVRDAEIERQRIKAEERRKREEEERRKREEEERKRREEVEKKKREEEERKRQEEERRRREEQERRKREEEERNRQEEERRKHETAEEKMRREEEERRKREEEESRHQEKDMVYIERNEIARELRQELQEEKMRIAFELSDSKEEEEQSSYGAVSSDDEYVMPELGNTNIAAPKKPIAASVPYVSQAVGKADDRLDKILLSQNVDGTWTLTKELCTLLKLNMDAIKASVPKGVTELLWFTAIVVAFLEATYAAHKDEWDLIVDKSFTIFRTNNAPSDLVAQAKSLLPKLSY